MSLRQVNVGRGNIAASIFLNLTGLINKDGTALIYGPKAHIFFFPSFLHSFFPSIFLLAGFNAVPAVVFRFVGGAVG
jgi:hypothetical protein